MTTQDLLYEITDGTGWVTFNRPERRNALTFAMYEGLAEICANAPTDGSVKAIVIRGAGERAFAAGTDMTQFRGFATKQDAFDYEDKMGSVLDRIERCPVPTIAAITAPASASTSETSPTASASSAPTSRAVKMISRTRAGPRIAASRASEATERQLPRVRAMGKPNFTGRPKVSTRSASG